MLLCEELSVCPYCWFFWQILSLFSWVIVHSVGYLYLSYSLCLGCSITAEHSLPPSSSLSLCHIELSVSVGWLSGGVMDGERVGGAAIFNRHAD